MQMNHYDLTQWADYVRGVAAPAEHKMGAHAVQCPSCAMLLAVLRRVAETTVADRAFEPPAQLVSEVESIFPPAPVAGTGIARDTWAALRRIAGQLAWNSLSDPMPAGVRTARPDLEHVVYRAGRYSVDLLLDSEPGASSVTMTGQIADESELGATLDNTVAVLFSGDRIVASTTTNAFGEFSLRYEASPNLQLVLPMEQAGEYVELALDMPQVNS
jgi:hypothetical protein